MGPFEKKLPIAVDLDGTLVFNELSYMSFWRFCRQYPWKLLLLPFWLFKGIAHIKRKFSALIPIDVKALNYNKSVLKFIESHGDHRVVLATGADLVYACQIAEYLDCFELVIASDGVVNMVSHNKAENLNKLFGKGQYIYVGNSAQDIAVWKDSAYAIAVNTPDTVLNDLKKLGVPFEILM